MTRATIAATTVLAAAALLLATAAFTGNLTKAKTKAYIRVDQFGYAPNAPKHAYLISTTPETGKAFAVQKAHGQTVVSGTIGHSIGTVNTTYRYVYLLAFGKLAHRGTYKVTAAKATSPPFRIASAQARYAKALANALSFYENERDGPNFIRSPLRTAPGHLNDRQARTYLPPKTNGNGNFKGSLNALPQFIDAAGGWWDAGDYLKFVETTSYTVAVMEAAVRDFPAQLGAGAPAASDFTAEARFGLNWLLHMWDEHTRTMYFQVGIGAGNRHAISDHDIWRLPQADDTWGGSDPAARYIRNRPVFRAGAAGTPVSPNIAG
ncbi:MAG: glycoside hydrolase family 9 protein, partial [Solirubrobacterales bacterium]|nr:glycoside hydrolase family 9 protein [Solirubrobacterales bacterium]